MGCALGFVPILRATIQTDERIAARSASDMRVGLPLVLGPNRAVELQMALSLLIKFVLQLQPGDEGDESCTHSLEFKSFKEFDQIVEIMQ